MQSATYAVRFTLFFLLLIFLPTEASATGTKTPGSKDLDNLDLGDPEKQSQHLMQLYGVSTGAQPCEKQKLPRKSLKGQHTLEQVSRSKGLKEPFPNDFGEWKNQAGVNDSVAWYRFARENAGSLKSTSSPAPGERIVISAAIAQDSMRTALYNNLLLQHYASSIFNANPDGGPVDTVAAVSWIQYLAASGHTEAELYHANLLMYGIGVQRDTVRAVEQITAVARKGVPKAQWALAACYLNGTGIKQDSEKGRYWRRLAAENGWAAAQHSLGIAIVNGFNEEQSDSAAVQWLLKAAEQGYSASQHMIGLAYLEGFEVQADGEKAVECLTAAAAGGYVRAMTRLGEVLLAGRVVDRDTETALALFHAAAARDDSRAKYMLFVVHMEGKGVPMDTVLAEQYLREAAEGGLAVAQYLTARRHIRHVSNGVYDSTVVYWLRSAAEQNHPLALQNMGYVHTFGYGVEKDLEKAESYLYQALEKGVDEAMVRNSLTYVYLYSEQNDKAMEQISTALSLRPDYASYHDTHGDVLRAMNRLEEAIAAYSRAIELDPEREYYYYNRGKTYAMAGEYEAAERDFRIALEKGYTEAEAELDRLIAEVETEPVSADTEP
ncbi:tetratricopeptide repeat protein [bacterium]|nr:tetratricopeptide repeat protein [bacterium]